ncbi:MAG: hypothetical protein R3C14_12245 [Caldilineaceae bacterium]
MFFHQKSQSGTDLAGSLPLFPPTPGNTLATSLGLADLRRKQLLFNRLAHPGQIHIYSAECRAGERLRLQLYVPVLPLGGAVAPAFAVAAQSLPYSADVQKLPLELPAGYSAVVAPPPGALHTPVHDMLTRVRYYPGPLVDTRTLVGGRCYVIVWSPTNQMGKYVLQVGSSWSWHWRYWLQLPWFWWAIRGWFGLSRAAGYLVTAGVAVVSLLLVLAMRRRK